MEIIYAIYNENYTQVAEEYTLDIVVKNLIEEEFEHNERHYSSDEFMEYHANFYEKLAPFYIKAKVTQLNAEDLQQVIHEFNEHCDSDNQLHLKTYLVPENKTTHFVSMLNEMGIHQFEELKEIKPVY